MAITEQDKQEIINALKAESQGIDELANVTTLDGVNSLPATRGTELVNVPVALLRKPAEDAAANANNKAVYAEAAGAQARSSADKADEAAEIARRTVDTMNEEIGLAREVIAEATRAAGRIDSELAAHKFINAQLLLDLGTYSTTLEAVIKKIAALDDNDKYMVDGIVLTFYGEDGWESWQWGWGDWLSPESWHPYGSGEGKGGNGSGFYNVTQEQPLTSGYYTLETAVAVAAAADIEDSLKRGMIITFESAAGRWSDYRFIGTDISSFAVPGAWEEYGTRGAVRQITVNGERKTPDESGNLNLTIEKTEVDESFDAASPNPVQNAVVTAKVAELEAGTLFGNEVIENEDGTVTVQLKSKSAVITDFTIPAGGGGGGGEAAGTKIVLNASVDRKTVKLGDPMTLTWNYDHVFTGEDSAGQSTGQKATVSIQVKRGSVTTYNETKRDVGAGTYTLDLTKYLLLGATDIYVTAETTDPTTGNPQRKPAYVAVKTVSLFLLSSYDIGRSLSEGGYGTHDTVEIPYSVSGSGTKSVLLYVDGKQRNVHAITRSGTVTDNFKLDMAGLAVGRHTVQMVAEMEADGLTLRSESIYFDILKRGENKPFIGTKIVHTDGRIFDEKGHLAPVIESGQYEKCQFEFVAYDPTVLPATVELWQDNRLLRAVSAPRSAQVYSNRFTDKGRHTIQLKIAATEYILGIDVTDSGIDISEATYGQILKLDASGRSNEESNPAVWSSNGVETTFEGFDWKSNGWVDGALKLTNGAKTAIGIKPFATDVKATGLTVELTMRVSNIMDKTATVISCMDGGKGLLITGQEASFRTGQTVTYTNEDDQQVTREIKLSTNYPEGEWQKVALVIGTSAQDRVMELYLNGDRNGADIYDSAFSFRQDNPKAITITSDEADVEIKNVRIYNRALTDDEELENRTVDADTTEEMMRVYSINDIMGENGDVDMDKLRAMGKGVLRIVRKNKLDDVYAENNKKTDFLADVYYYSALGKEYDFVLLNCFIRIQGTSSTKYPSKNLRIYFTKGSELLSMTGDNVSSSNKYRMRPGAVPVPVICCKSDYSDSSMSLNTGGAKLFNDVMKELGLLTPPQRHQYEQAGGSLAAVNVRTAIDGMPIDIFCAETVDGENTYYGQYNFNNEKSKSGPVFGMEGVDGYTAECPIALEMLNNTSPICLFSTTSDAELAEKFDAGAEVNYGIDATGKVQSDGDVKWAGLAPAQQEAIKRLYAWIRSCVPSNADPNNLATFHSEKFRNEIDQYFNRDFILTYYIHTDYFGSVDQRAKNMMLRTWDGWEWYITYYDGDTQLGKRNDCFLIYLYTMGRTTWDAEASKYAFEGFASCLWNLCLANLGDDLKRCAERYRSVMTTERVLAMLNDEQSGNWSERAFNKSGYLKYISPATREMYGKVWPFIYALQGSNRGHRTYFVRNRFALLDAQYGTANFTSDNIDLYLARQDGDSADRLRITANEPYAFGYGTNNSPNIANTGIVDGGDSTSLEITGAYTVNDPLRVYGASRMKVLDMTGAANHLKNALDLGKCTVLRELNLSTNGAGSTGWWLSLSSCRQLRVLNLKGQAQAKTGGSTSTALDLSSQTKLESLDARGTTVQSVVFAKGAPVTVAKLPGTLTTLRLEYLGKLTTAGLTLESYNNVRTLVFDNCPGIDWETLLGRCTRLDRLRVTGIDREDDGTWLSRFTAMGGVDAAGNYTDTCSLVGTVRLTRYLEEERYAELCAHFPELNIIQPQYTVIEHDINVADDANVTNRDNGTGYVFGNQYVPSGHIAAILAKRHKVLAKVTKKATTRNVRIADTDTVMNNLDGEMTYFPLHDGNSNFYADAADVRNATAAKLDSTEGDIMMYEPRIWCKGVNDYLAGKAYSCYSSNYERPAIPVATVMTLDDIKDKGGYRTNAKIMTGKTTLSASYSNDTAFSVCEIDVKGYRRVRFPSVLGSSLVGSVFIDAAGNVVENIVVPTIAAKFLDGMYLIKDVPEGAERLSFTVRNGVDFDKVVLSNSDKIEDMESEWYCDEEHLCAAVESTVVGTKLRSCVSGGASTASMSWVDFHYYSVQRGMQQIDGLMHNRIANLFYAKYGRRDSQSQCGAGQHTNMRVTGGSMSRGMTDTVGYEAARAIDPNATYALVDNINPQYSWYADKDAYGTLTAVRVNNSCALGYEDIYGDKYEMMDGVDLPNTTSLAQGAWRYWMPDGTTRIVRGALISGQWITGVAHGLYMDMVPTGGNGTNSTYYTDQYWVSTASGRVVYRGYFYAYAGGGVSCAYASYDASNSYTNVGSRLAFRGQIVRAQSVTAFKAITEVA